jgi:hypothetical protein
MIVLNPAVPMHVAENLFQASFPAQDIGERPSNHRKSALSARNARRRVRKQAKAITGCRVIWINNLILLLAGISALAGYGELHTIICPSAAASNSISMPILARRL